MAGEQVSMLRHFDTRFDDLKAFLNEKFDNLEKADDDLEGEVRTLKDRVSRLEKWVATIGGAGIVLGVLGKLLYDVFKCMIA